MVAKALFTSTTDEWSTPQDLFDELDREFGFVLDVCATKENAKCDRYYTRKDDGLSQEWRLSALGLKPRHGHLLGAVWMNPPYGREIGKWVAKAETEACKGATVVCLLPARTDTRWFHNHIWGHERPQVGVVVRLLSGRLKFGGSKNSAPFPSMVVVFRPRPGIDGRPT